MPFNEFKDVGQVMKIWGLQKRNQDLFGEIQYVKPEEYLPRQIQRALSRRKGAPSEIFYRETLIAPILYDTLAHFNLLDVWSSEYRFELDARLTGTPDYLLAALPEPGVVPGYDLRPLLAVAEAKREDYIGGWGQCLAEMVACQRLNQSPETPVWGIVTTGETWQFGRLVGAGFTQHYQSVDLDPLDKLLGILHYIFAECQAIAEQWAEEAKENDSSSKTI